MEILNRKAHFNYEIEDTYEAGIVLTGSEVKSIRSGNVNIKDSYAIIRNGECFILNMHISSYKEANQFNHEEKRTRKLLLNKREILKINNYLILEGYSLVPIKLYFVKGKVKILLGLGKGKKLYDKREVIKKKDQIREIKKMVRKNEKI
jgi:SsrA-binding protein